MEQLAVMLGMLGMGTSELIIIGIIVMLLFGGKKIPELMKGLGKGISDFKKAKDDVEEDIKSNQS